MKLIKTIIKSIAVAFSIYSKIPMPRFMWDTREMEYHLIFFPWVGAAIAALECMWIQFCYIYSIGEILRVTFALAIPLIVTGGFHLDGFMDTMDAVHSYQEKEKKLEILKDPHIGAFSVISLVIYGLLAMGFASVIDCWEAVYMIGISFVLSRILSAIAVVTFPAAKKTGMLATFSNTAQKQIVLILLVLQGLICVGLSLLIDFGMGFAMILVMICHGIFYRFWSEKLFGGITGDLAGYFVSVSELLVLITMGIFCIFR